MNKRLTFCYYLKSIIAGRNYSYKLYFFTYNSLTAAFYPPERIADQQLPAPAPGVQFLPHRAPPSLDA